MFDKEKVKEFIDDYWRMAVDRYNIANLHQMTGSEFTLIKAHMWDDMEMARLVPHHTGDPQKRKPGTEKIYMAVEKMISDSHRELANEMDKQQYGESVKKLGKTLVNLHECSKKGMTKKGYSMFKEAMANLMTLEGNGCKSKVLKNAKEILKEYYNTYKTQIKKDTTRVIVEGKAEDVAKKAEDKRQTELKMQLKSLIDEIASNVGENKDSGMKRAIKTGNYELINFHADQLAKIVTKIKAIVNEEINDYLE